MTEPFGDVVARARTVVQARFRWIGGDADIWIRRVGAGPGHDRRRLPTSVRELLAPVCAIVTADELPPEPT